MLLAARLLSRHFRDELRAWPRMWTDFSSYAESRSLHHFGGRPGPGRMRLSPLVNRPSDRLKPCFPPIGNDEEEPVMETLWTLDRLHQYDDRRFPGEPTAEEVWGAFNQMSEALREAMRRQGLSIRATERAVGMVNSTLTNFLNNKNFLRAQNVRKAGSWLHQDAVRVAQWVRAATVFLSLAGPRPLRS